MMNLTSDAPLIRVQNLTKSFDDVTVLKDVNFEIQKGELFSLIGPSGCGKSTLLRCLNCLESMDFGKIEIAGIHINRERKDQPREKGFQKKLKHLRQKVGMVFQDFNLFPHKTLLQNVMLAPMLVRGMSHAQAEEKSVQLLKKVGLESFKDRYPANLSGGQQQRGAIARALAMSPEVMLYDEPTSALDPEMVHEVLEVMRTLDAEGMTQIIVTHEMSFAKNASDYIVYMEQGQIVEIADEDEIFENPKDERTRRFLKKVKGLTTPV